MTSCHLLQLRPKPPVLKVQTPAGLVQQTGQAEKPAQVNQTQSQAKLEVPAGSKLVIDEVKHTTEVVVAKDTTFVAKQDRAEITTPTAFAPPMPPTPTQLADGQVHGWAWLGVAVGTAAALFGLVRGWDFVMWGGVCVTSASLLLLFVSQHPIVFALLGAGVAIKVAGPVLWHTKIKPLAAATNASIQPQQTNG